jgi:hypothetical protein
MSSSIAQHNSTTGVDNNIEGADNIEGGKPCRLWLPYRRRWQRRQVIWRVSVL